MHIYLVGGAVRDGLLGLPGADRDWVVVGATPEQMLALGYEPVGRDFPVFLHPQTREEHALARTERKTAPGYKGFVVHASPEVTLEEDLARRDLTINAMAQDQQGQLIDPHGGRQDLNAQVLRHVTPAFREDPVRILRLARFAARFPTFEVAAPTQDLCRQMVQSGEVDALVPERVWQELARGLQASCPGRMAEVLIDCGAWAHLWPELPANTPERARAWDLLQAWTEADLGQRWALWLAGATSDQVQAINTRYRVPSEVADTAWGWAMHQHALLTQATDPHQACEQLHRMDTLRRPERAQAWIELAQHWADSPERQAHAAWWKRAWQAVCAVDAKAVNHQAVQAGLRGPAIGQALIQAHTEAIARLR